MVEAATTQVESVIGKRVELRGKAGSIRFLGKLRNNAKAGDALWLGIEWDEMGTGKHNGTVDGEHYFACEFHITTEEYAANQTKCCSFIREGKIDIGGISFSDAILQRYKPENMMSEREKELERQKEEAEQYVVSTRNRMVKIEMVGFEQSYQERADVQNSKDISLEEMNISEVGALGELRKLIPGTMNLYLDKNKLYNWDQYFEIMQQLPYLMCMTLTGNRLRRIPEDYFEGKDVAAMIHCFLTEVIFIEMALDWPQILTLSPALKFIEQLHLVRNNCNVICSQYPIPVDHLQNLKFINLEGNSIASWDEVVEFRTLPNLKRMTLNKNRIQSVYYKPGFNELRMLSMEENLIDNWASFDALNQFPYINNLRVNGNPIFNEEIGGPRARECAIARVQHVRTFNGTPIEDYGRKDHEVSYCNEALRECLLHYETPKEEIKIEQLEDPRLSEFMNQRHPRWYALVEMHGNPLGTIKLKNEKHNIATSSARVQLISEVDATMGKTLEKKLLLKMTVAQLKAMCSKLFKIEVTQLLLMYVEEGVEGEYDFEEEYRQLSFYSIKDGGKIYIRPIC